jgi:hypothetical protein
MLAGTEDQLLFEAMPREARADGGPFRDVRRGRH